MSLACDICEKLIPWKEFMGERFQPHGTVKLKKPKRTYTHCFAHSIDEVDQFIKADIGKE